MRVPLHVCISSLLTVTLAATPAAAQDPPASPAPGVRAAGMGGAFTAVADDGSAVYWNPAGLASGAFFSLVLDRNTGDGGNATLLSLATPPLGLSYYRTSTGDTTAGGHSLTAHHAGVTFVQSLADRLAVGATVKVVRGTARSGASAGISSTKLDADIGVMTTGSLGRMGVAVHNLTSPSFDSADGPVTLERQVRAGISLNTGRFTTVAADVDLTTIHQVATGRPWREVAIGAETRPLAKGWVRGGLHWSTSGAAAPIGTIGASYAIYGATMADAHVSFGSRQGNRGWGAGVRFVF